MNTAQRALRLKMNTYAALSSGAARFLPPAVLSLIEEQAAVVAQLAHDVHRLESLMDIGRDGQ